MSGPAESSCKTSDVVFCPSYDGLVFRPACVDDLRAILALHHQLHPTEQIDQPVAAGTFGPILARPGTTPFVLDEDGTPVTTSYLVVVPNLTHGYRPFAVIENVVVDERHRRHGLGRRLMAGTLQAA